MSESKDDELTEKTLSRLARGLPKRELKMMITEADECEAALLKDIELLEKALENETDDDDEVNAILESPLTPLDRYWTASALLGRLRDPLALPSILTVTGSVPAVPPSSIKSPDAATLVALGNNPVYTKKHETTAELLATWKKISSHRASAVFRKPVKPEEAPGYSDRIVFPMDLSLIRKMIVTRHIQSYAQLHEYVGLISHNCVKFNGRENDYGIVAREFEAVADEYIRQACTGSSASPVPTSSTSAAAATAPKGPATKS